VVYDSSSDFLHSAIRSRVLPKKLKRELKFQKPEELNDGFHYSDEQFFLFHFVGVLLM
jgi:hypothetical protein